MYNVPQILTILTLWSVESRFLEEAEEIFKDYFSGLPYIPVEPQKFQCSIYVGNRYVIIPNKYINKSLSKLVGFSEDIEIRAFAASLVSKGADYCIYNYANSYGMCLTIHVKTEYLEKLYLEDI